MVSDPEGHELVLLNPSKEELKVQDLIDGLKGDNYEVVAKLQALDPFCKCLINNLKKGRLNPNDVYVMHLQDHLLSCQLQRAYTPTFPKWVSFAKCGKWFGMKSHLLLLGLPQPIRGFPTIESGTFQCKTRGVTSCSI